MSSAFASLEMRKTLLYRLMKEGFHVRMHAYEYFIRRGGKFVCVVVLYPTWGSAHIYKISWNPKESEEAIQLISKILKEMDPNINLKVISTQ